MHFFGSLERFSIDRAEHHQLPDPPGPERPADHADRVWNTIVRGDHQMSPNHTYNVRWLREQSPQKNQIMPTGTHVFPTGGGA